MNVESVYIALLVLTHLFFVPCFDLEPDTNTTTAPTEGTTEAPIHPECRVPAYSSINYETMYNNTVTDDSLLIVEGKCYVECILALSQNQRYGVSVKLPLIKACTHNYKYMHTCI